MRQGPPSQRLRSCLADPSLIQQRVDSSMPAFQPRLPHGAWVLGPEGTDFPCALFLHVFVSATLSTVYFQRGGVLRPQPVWLAATAFQEQAVCDHKFAVKPKAAQEDLDAGYFPANRRSCASDHALPSQIGNFQPCVGVRSRPSLISRPGQMSIRRPGRAL